jgi:hypothetical protein
LSLGCEIDGIMTEFMTSRSKVLRVGSSRAISAPAGTFAGGDSGPYRLAFAAPGVSLILRDPGENLLKAGKYDIHLSSRGNFTDQSRRMSKWEQYVLLFQMALLLMEK